MPWPIVLPILVDPVNEPMLLLVDAHGLGCEIVGGGAIEKGDVTVVFGGGGGRVKDGERFAFTGACWPTDRLDIDRFMLPPKADGAGVEAAEPQGFDAAAVAVDQLIELAEACCCSCGCCGGGKLDCGVGCKG